MSGTPRVPRGIKQKTPMGVSANADTIAVPQTSSPPRSAQKSRLQLCVARQRRFVGRVAHAVCYVTEDKAYLDYNNRKYALNVERCGATLREIAAQVADWLALSRHAGRIAAVRGAHPRHGGQGALYVILRRRR